MALYRFEAKIISRSGGRSTVGAASYRTGKCAISAAAYRAGAELTDERTGVTYDYSRKRGVEGAEIKLPEHAPAWMADRQQLWNAVERVEGRKDAQLARDFIISLPHELNPEQRQALLGEFLDRNFSQRGYVCDVAYHAPHGKGDDRNHHAHVMVPMRTVTEDGFAAKKERPEGNPHAAWQADLARMRKDWADTTNRHLEAAGCPERVSHLSLAEQGLDREPEPKQGPIATQMEREGRESHAGNDRREAQARNAERAALKAEHAATITEISNIVSLEAERIRRTPMTEPTEQELELQRHKEAAAWRQMQATDERLQQERAVDARKRQAEQEAAEAKERERQNRERAEREAQAGEIADAKTRYGIALGQNYDIRDPYGSLARAAMEEYAAFHKEQQNLRQQIAKEQDEGRRAELDLRRQIEANEYMTITSQRLAGISAAIAGRNDAPQAVIDREKAIAYQQRAYELREQYEAKQKERQERERQQQQGKDDRQAESAPQRQQEAEQRRSAGNQQQPSKVAANDEKPAERQRNQEASDRTAREQAVRENRATDADRVQLQGEGKTVRDDKREKLDRSDAGFSKYAGLNQATPQARGGGRGGRR